MCKMYVRTLFGVVLLSLSVQAQLIYYRVCIPQASQTVCNQIQLGNSRVRCEPVETSIDCALKLSRREAELGVFTEEELLLLSQLQPDVHRVIGNVRHRERQTQDHAFEAVAVVSTSHSGGLDGLRGSSLCHPGFDNRDQRWSPRVLRQLEQRAARTDRCSEELLPHRTFEELEVPTLSEFFGPSCRPGPWSNNATLDAQLKRENPTLCHICNEAGNSENCDGYSYDMGVQISGVDHGNRHIQALHCLTNNNNSVAYVAWDHVTNFFKNRSPHLISSYALLCEDGTLQQLTDDILDVTSSPCAWVRQPWRALVASDALHMQLQSEIRDWWPSGVMPSEGWQGFLFDHLIGGQEYIVQFIDTLTLPTIQAHVTPFRNLTSLQSAPHCQSSPRWCTTSAAEFQKCTWTSVAAFTLGLQPVITCTQRDSVFSCMQDITDRRADFISLDSNYGYLARIHFNLAAVKLVQNSIANSTRIAAIVKQTAAQSEEITRFENLRGTRACFPEYGGLAFMSFVRAAHERAIVSVNECDYGRAVGEFFSESCAPGALDRQHTLVHHGFNSTTLCTVCRNAFPVQGHFADFTCAADNSNLFYSDNGTIACLNDPDNQVAFIETQHIERFISSQQLNPLGLRVLCRNNSLALNPGVNVDDECLLALVVNEEIMTRRNDDQVNSLTSLLTQLDDHFGYRAARPGQLINLQIFSAFDGQSDLLFLDSALGLTEPSLESNHVPAINYIELFSHLEACSGAAEGMANKAMISLLTILFMNFMIRWVL